MVAALSLLAACGGSKSDDAPATAPSGFTVEPVDGGVIARWNQDPALTYWIFSAEAGSITRDDYNRFPSARITQPATSPQFIGLLANGRTYSFLINATQSGSPAGPSTPSIAATPRPAGDTWTFGAPLSAADLNAVALGGTVGNARYVAVGNGGAVFTRPVTIDGNWTAATSGVNANLNGLLGAGQLVAVGDSGTVITSTDGLTWTARTSGSTARLNAVAVTGSTYIAVGDGGVILRSADAATWTALTSGTTANLYQVVAIAGSFYALGANGTLIRSTDLGDTWTAIATGSTAALRAIAFNSARYVIVGDGGTILTSPDIGTWTAVTPVTTRNLRRIAFSSRFVAVGEAGTILVSSDGLAWTTANSGSSADLRGLQLGSFAEFHVVGSAGANGIAR